MGGGVGGCEEGVRLAEKKVRLLSLTLSGVKSPSLQSPRAEVGHP